MKTKKGFTLVELLVVIAVIALLMSILMPALRRAKDMAMRVMCGNDLKQIMLAFTIYSDKYAGKFPAPDFMNQPLANEEGNQWAGKFPRANGGYWPWDGPYDVINELLKCMGKNLSDFKGKPGHDDPIPPQPIFYCPSNVQQKRFLNTNWSYSIGIGQGGRPDGYRVLGYAFMWYAGWNTTNLGPGTRPIRSGLDSSGKITNREDSLPDPMKKWVDRSDIPQASEVELVVDTAMSERRNVLTGEVYNLNQYPNGNFATVTSGGNPGLYGSPDQSSHLVSDSKVAGGNIGFVDNHVEWRNFKDMRNRITQGPMWWW
jgi:prepilin-type N-terminal cleavage/methylation domain-containing protein